MRSYIYFVAYAKNVYLNNNKTYYFAFANIKYATTNT